MIKSNRIRSDRSSRVEIRLIGEIFTLRSDWMSREQTIGRDLSNDLIFEKS